MPFAHRKQSAPGTKLVTSTKYLIVDSGFLHPQSPRWPFDWVPSGEYTSLPLLEPNLHSYSDITTTTIPTSESLYYDHHHHHRRWMMNKTALLPGVSNGGFKHQYIYYYYYYYSPFKTFTPARIIITIPQT